MRVQDQLRVRAEASEIGSRMIEPNPMTIQGQVRMTIAATANHKRSLDGMFFIFGRK